MITDNVKNSQWAMLEWVYLCSIDLYDQRPSSTSACVISSMERGHFAINVKSVISQNQWISFALI